jgi:hypothetical protein
LVILLYKSLVKNCKVIILSLLLNGLSGGRGSFEGSVCFENMDGLVENCSDHVLKTLGLLIWDPTGDLREDFKKVLLME